MSTKCKWVVPARPPAVFVNQVMSHNGMMIKKMKQFVSRCNACFNVNPKMDSAFCPRCGSDFVVKVTMTTVRCPATSGLHVLSHTVSYFCAVLLSLSRCGTVQ
eukprot:SAG11_NODE_255_length_11590_cov_2.516665_3_plen_103_part_00